MLTLGTLRLGLIVVAVIAGMTGLYVIFDAIGDLREAKVRAAFDEAARRKNVDISAYNDAESAIDAIVAAKVKEALERSKAVPSELKYTADQAQAINAIRQAGGR